MLFIGINFRTFCFFYFFSFTKTSRSSPSFQVCLKPCCHFQGKKEIDRIYHILIKNSTTIQYGKFYPQIIITVTKNLVTVTIIWVKVTTLYCCAICFQPEYGKFYQYFFPVLDRDILALRRDPQWSLLTPYTLIRYTYNFMLKI